ncbi:PadR family transcriptional regulator [Bacillus badius]|nr:hypothetical protein A6M11_14015 [Bacillus badius]OVE48230.1 hypothetical protein B1A98_17830 [Bacillus badius]UAT32501.1 PadR family transcriptional regulator [Bacillus badius]
MMDRLKDLKKLSHQQAFPELQFTPDLQKRIYEDIHKKEEKEEEILLAIFQLLKKKKEGFELLSNLRSRGISKFNQNEGFLYTLLHLLEQKGYIAAEWKKDGNKYYFIQSKGIKVLSKLERNNQNVLISLREIWKGAMIHG